MPENPKAGNYPIFPLVVLWDDCKNRLCSNGVIGWFNLILLYHRDIPRILLPHFSKDFR